MSAQFVHGDTVSNGPRSRGIDLAALDVVALAGRSQNWGWEFVPHTPLLSPERDHPPHPDVRDYGAAYAAWSRRIAEFERSQLENASSTPLFRPSQVGSGHALVTLFGGTSRGWQSLLVTLGLSTLASGQSLRVVNLSDRSSHNVLTTLAASRGFTVREDRMTVREDGVTTVRPTFEPLAGLASKDTLRDVVAALAPGRPREGATAATDDESVLRRVARKLDEPLTVARLAAALRVTVRDDDTDDRALLGERERVELMTLFGDEVRRGGLVERLVVLAERVGDLARLCLTPLVTPEPEVANLKVVSVDQTMSEGDFDRAVALLAPGLVREARSIVATAGFTVVLGAERLRPRIVETLAALSFGRTSPTLLCFTHLTEEAQVFLGADNSCAMFMRLANSKEASLGASYVGNEWKFVMSEVTASRGRSGERGTGSSASTESGTSVSGSGSFGFSRTDSVGTNESSSVNMSSGSSETIGASMARVHELVIEPESLQALSETAVVVVERDCDQRRLRLLDCQPELAGEPRVSPH